MIITYYISFSRQKSLNTTTIEYIEHTLSKIGLVEQRQKKNKDPNHSALMQCIEHTHLEAKKKRAEKIK